MRASHRYSKASVQSQEITVRLSASLVLTASLVLVGFSSTQTSDEAAVRAAINQYFKGHSTAQTAEMSSAFLPTAHIEGIRDGVFTSWTAAEYSGRFSGRPAADEANRKRTIDDVDVSGTAAMAKATLVHGATTFTDYFVLLKVNGTWKIANKVYSSRPTK
jgi:hypothetical protein